jgi:fatty aldehyde-generating acyl-ACP reductase
MSRTLPYLTTKAPWFSFLVHPRDTGDLLRSPLGAAVRKHSNSETEFLARVSSLPPMVLGEIKFGFAPIHGELVVAMCLPDEILRKRGQRAVFCAAELAVKRGAKVIGLGALTAPATGGGLLLMRHLPPGVTVTNGNAYTAVIVCQNVLEVCSFLVGAGNARVAVVGCTGSVGFVLSHLLADAGFDLLLIGRNADRARSILGSLEHRAVFSGELASVREAQIVVLLTSDPSAKLSPEFVSPGAIVIDVSQPPNISVEEQPAFKAREVEVVQGGLVRIPDYTCNYDLNNPHSDDVFACLGETYLFAREGFREHSVGRPDVQFAYTLERVARKHGLTPSPLGTYLRGVNSKANVTSVA